MIVISLILCALIGLQELLLPNVGAAVWRFDFGFLIPRPRIQQVLGSTLFCVLLFTLCVLAHAQEPPNVTRIGYLSASSAAEASSRTAAFRSGLRELGYFEGRNLKLDFRYANGSFDRLPALAAELVQMKVAVIVTAGPSVTRPVSEATRTIPIVMTNDSDPVGSGFVASLARPGGNITGLSSLAQELSGKRLEILKEYCRSLRVWRSWGVR